MAQQVDIAIVGAGMVGATLACALAQKTDFSIALIEATETKVITEDAPYALRVSALNSQSQQLLTELGIWQRLPPQRLSPFETMQVWEGEAKLAFHAAEIGAATLGHIVENPQLTQAAMQRIQQLEQIQLICPAQLTDWQDNQLIFADHPPLTAKLVIAADGSHSLLRDWAGIETTGWQYGQQGLVCTVKTEMPHHAIARQHFLAGGPLAFLPLADPHCCSIVWSLPEKQANDMAAIDAMAFNEKLAAAFEYQAGAVSVISDRRCFTLQLQHARQYVKTGFALVGDAAHSVHPLAGQGVNLGFQDVIALTTILQQAEQQQRDISSLHVLKKYQRQRLAENLLMQLSLDGFHRLFGSNATPVIWMRRYGMQQINRLAPLKQFFMRHAVGR